MDLGPYLLRLLVLLPLLSAIIVGGLWLARRYAGLGGGGPADAPARLVGALALGPGARLAVVEFGGRRLLVSIAKNGVMLMGETAAPGGVLEGGRVVD